MSLHSVIIDQNLDVWVFGANIFGELGLGDNVSRDTPTKIETLPPIIATSQWCTHTLFLDIQGYVWISGQIFESNVPRKIDQVENIAKIATGENHCILLDYEGNVFYFAYANNSSTRISNVPKIKDICVNLHTMLLDFEGNVFSFGRNGAGQLGHGDQLSRFIPTKIKNLPPIQSFSASIKGSVLVDFDGNAYSCGNNEFHQLGFGDTNLRLTPTKIPLKTKIKSAHTVATFTLLHDIDNNLWVLGDDITEKLSLGQCNNNKVTTLKILPFNEEICRIYTNGCGAIITNTKGECFSFRVIIPGHTQNINVPTKIDSLEVPALTLQTRRFSTTKNARL